MKKKAKVLMTPRTEDACTNSISAIESVGDEAEQLYNSLSFKKVHTGLMVLPKRIRRPMLKELGKLIDAAIQIQLMADDAADWMSDNMEKFHDEKR